MAKFPPIVTSVYSLLCGTILLLPYGIWEIFHRSWHFNNTSMLVLLYMGCQFEQQPFTVLPYNQNDWVLTQNYQSIPILEIVGFWTALNKQIVRVISKISEEKLLYLCDIGDNKSITLFELIQDYLGHMDHHLIQIFGTADL